LSQAARPNIILSYLFVVNKLARQDLFAFLLVISHGTQGIG